MVLKYTRESAEFDAALMLAGSKKLGWGIVVGRTTDGHPAQILFAATGRDRAAIRFVPHEKGIDAWQGTAMAPAFAAMYSMDMQLLRYSGRTQYHLVANGLHINNAVRMLRKQRGNKISELLTNRQTGGPNTQLLGMISQPETKLGHLAVEQQPTMGAIAAVPLGCRPHAEDARLAPTKELEADIEPGAGIGLVSNKLEEQLKDAPRPFTVTRHTLTLPIEGSAAETADHYMSLLFAASQVAVAVSVYGPGSPVDRAVAHSFN